MQMIITPCHQQLNRVVQISNRAVRAHAHRAPDGRLDAGERDVERVGRSVVWDVVSIHHVPSGGVSSIVGRTPRVNTHNGSASWPEQSIQTKAPRSAVRTQWGLGGMFAGFVDYVRGPLHLGIPLWSAP